MKRPILVIGSINLDLVVHASRIPAPGETLLGSTFQRFHGGKGANQAVACSRLGYPTAMIGHVGKDDFGSELLSGLQSFAVETSAIASVAGPSGIALITRSNDGENSIVVVSGANGTVSAEALQAHRPTIAAAGFLLMQLEIPVEAVEFAATIAAQAHVPVILDPAPAQPLPQSLLRNISWLTPNETETATLLGRPAELFSPQQAAEKLLCLGVRNVVLKMGRRGVYLAGRDCPSTAVEAFSVDPLDTTAAGDAFNAAFTVRLLQGRPPAEAAVYANAAAAISVTRAGAQPSMPTAQEVEAFLREKIPANQVEVVLRT